MKLCLELIKNNLYIKGDLVLFEKNYRLFNWLMQDFNLLSKEEEFWILEQKHCNSENFLFEFRMAFEEKFKNFAKVEFGQNFSNLIGNQLSEKEKFELFTEEARNIRSNEFDINRISDLYFNLQKTLPRRKLYNLQLLSALHLCYSQNACNFSVPGAGKTSIVYAAYSYLNSLPESDARYLNKIVIIGPPSSFQPWEDEYQSCFGVEPKSFRINGEKSSEEKKNFLNGITSNNSDIILITYNSVPNLSNELLSFIGNPNNKVMLICDEAHKIKNYNGVWSNHVMKIAKNASSRIVLTGTPCPNGYEDLYILFKFLYPEKNLIDFRPAYLKRLTKNGKEHEIKNLIDSISPFFVRIKKSDLNLPEVTEHPIIYNEFDEIESSIYRELENNIKSENKTSKIGLMIRMIQAANNIQLLKKPLMSMDNELFGKLGIQKCRIEEILSESSIKTILSLSDSYVPSKHRKVLEIVNQIVKRGEKVIIWGVFVDSIKQLNKYLKSNGLKGTYVIGQTSKSENSNEEMNREWIINDFKNNSETNYLITNPAVLGESISLHKVCHHAIYFEMSYSAAPYLQSKDRIHRVWLNDAGSQISYETNYYHIISSKSCDKNILDRVKVKIKRMMDIVEQEIPLFIENHEDEIRELIREITEQNND